jgi:hypothetical protein
VLLLELVEEDLGDLVDDAGVLGGDEIPVDDTRDGLAAVVDDGAAAFSTSQTMLWAQVTQRPSSRDGSAQKSQRLWQMVPILSLSWSIASTALRRNLTAGDWFGLPG